MAAAAQFSRNHRLWTHASKGARTLMTLSYMGGSVLPALVIGAIYLVEKANRLSDARERYRGNFHHARLGAAWVDCR